MIGSLMSRMATAEKLSVAQLQQAIKDGTLPAYVGIPLLQDKMQQEKEARAAAAGMQQKQPPIAEQVMQEASAAEAAPQGIDTVPSNLPAQGMAGGGIVAFANGDLVDDDEEDTTDEEARQLAEIQSLFDSAAGRLGRDISEGHGAGITGAYAMKPESHGVGINPEAKGSRGFADKLEHIESRGRDFDKEGKILTSSKGAMGRMQTMPETLRDPGFGVKPAKNNSPEELARVGRDYANALKDFYKGDEQLAAMAYNWGPGNVNKWIAGGRKGEVPGETRNYLTQLASLAKGGQVRHFATGDYVGFGEETPYDPNEPSIFDTLGRMMGSPGERMKNQAYGRGFVTDASLKEAAKKADEKKVVEDATKNLPPAGPLNPPNAAPTGAGIDTAIASKGPSIEDKYLELLKGREASSAKQRSVDNYMALLQAGLGMMGGTSPYTAVNIGQGASAGVAAKLASEKNRIAEEAATMKGYGTLYNQQQNAEMRKMLAGQSNEAKIGQMIGMREKQLESLAKDTVLKTGLLADSAEAQAKIAKEVERLKSGDEYLKKLYTQYGLPPIQSAGPSGVLSKDDLIKQAQENKKRLGY